LCTEELRGAGPCGPMPALEPLLPEAIRKQGYHHVDALAAMAAVYHISKGPCGRRGSQMRDHSFTRSYSLNDVKGASVLKRPNTKGHPTSARPHPLSGWQNVLTNKKPLPSPMIRRQITAVSSPAVRCNPDLSRRADQWARFDVGRREEDVCVGFARLQEWN